MTTTANRAGRRATAKKATKAAPKKTAPRKRAPVPTVEARLAELEGRFNQLAWYHAELSLQFKSLLAAAMLQQVQPELHKALVAKMNGQESPLGSAFKANLQGNPLAAAFTGGGLTMPPLH